MLIYIVRHGQTDWNAERRLQGQRDIPLNDFGRGQARANGTKLKTLIDDPARLDFISSPLGRTRETMELMRDAMGLDRSGYQTDARLVEICFGDWEGYTLEDMSGLDSARLAEREADKWHFIPPGENAESYEILSWRVGSWLRSIERDTLCVCHGGVIRALFVLTGQISRDEAAHSDIPQDRILVFDGSSLNWI